MTSQERKQEACKLGWRFSTKAGIFGEAWLSATLESVGISDFYESELVSLILKLRTGIVSQFKFRLKSSRQYCEMYYRDIPEWNPRLCALGDYYGKSRVIAINDY